MANVPAPKKIANVDTPCFLVDIERMEDNCERMRQRCIKMGVKLRPMMKTHKTIEIAEIMTDGTRECIEGSTLKECEFYADNGFDDILFTGIFTADKLTRMKALATKLKRFHVMIDDHYGINLLEENPLPSGKHWSVFLMVNVGGNRSGVTWDGTKAMEVASRLHDTGCVDFQGLYGHEGSASYCATSKEEIFQKSEGTASNILDLANRLRKAGMNLPCVGLGSTPSCSQPASLMSKLDEFHPGNYCFYDAMQAIKGSCDWSDIAGRVATRVTGHYPETNQLLVDAGFLAVSMDGKNAFGDKGSYALIQDHPELKLKDMHQETGFITSVDGKPLQFSKYPIGSLLFLLPWHSCATACAYNMYLIHRDEDIIDTWIPCTGW